jgi:hypothetical protein
MSPERAAELVDAFMTETSRHDARYFTNVDASWPSGTFATCPATSATFDSGVLVVSSTGSACLWFEDED